MRILAAITVLFGLTGISMLLAAVIFILWLAFTPFDIHQVGF